MLRRTVVRACDLGVEGSSEALSFVEELRPQDQARRVRRRARHAPRSRRGATSGTSPRLDCEHAFPLVCSLLSMRLRAGSWPDSATPRRLCQLVSRSLAVTPQPRRPRCVTQLLRKLLVPFAQAVKRMRQPPPRMPNLPRLPSPRRGRSFCPLAVHGAHGVGAGWRAVSASMSGSNGRWARGVQVRAAVRRLARREHAPSAACWRVWAPASTQRANFRAAGSHAVAAAVPLIILALPTAAEWAAAWEEAKAS
jgi:hypothetical protein